MNRLNDLKQTKLFNEMCRQLISIQNEVSRGMFELEPDQEMFDLLFEIGGEVQKVHKKLIELYSYKNE